MNRLRLLATFLATSLALVACGGGGGGSSGSDATATGGAPTVPAVVTPGVTGAAPATAAPGIVVTFTGQGFSRVTAVAFGGVTASFNVVSDSQLTATVPAGVTSASVNVTLSGTGFSVQTPIAIVLDIPTLTSASGSQFTVGASILVQGTRLDLARSFSVGGTTLTATGVTPTSATLKLPTTPISGSVVLTYAAGTVYTSAVQIASYVPLGVSAFSAGAAVPGDSVTIVGTGLDAVTSVVFGNGTSGLVTARSATSLTFTVPALPAAAASQPFSGALTLISPFQQFITSSALSIGPSLTIGRTTATTDHRVTLVNVNGSNLSLVTAATVAGAKATVVSTSDTLCVLSVPGEASGTVLLSTLYQRDVSAGNVVITSLGVISLSELDFAQVMNKASTDASLRLTPNRPVLARAYVTSSAANTPNPGVVLTASNGATPLGGFGMAGPLMLPMSTAADNLTTTYNVTVPAAWVKPGVTFKATLMPSAGFPVPQVVTATPTVGAAAQLHVVLVPLGFGASVGVVPSLSEVHDAFARVYPMASDSIVVTRRAAYAVSGLTQITTSAQLSTVLNQVETLRRAENPSAFYYGMFPAAIDSAGFSGLGYLGSPGAEARSAASAIGYDATYKFATIDPFDLALPAWVSAMLHEIGHTHSLQHAPCGNPTGVDPSYPYAGGILNPTMPVYSSRYVDDTAIGALSPSVTAAGSMKDVMGYCSGIFLSDYNYAKVQLYAEARTASLPQPDALIQPAAINPSTPGYLVLSGTITAKGASLNPALATVTAPPGDASSDTAYAVRVTTDLGATFTHPVTVNAVADSTEPEVFFSHTLPNPGNLMKVEVLKDGKVIGDAESTAIPTRRAAAARAAGASTERSASWSETGGRLRLTWNAAAEPYATVTHVADAGTRTVVAFQIEGGDASIDTTALPRGGRFELSLSSWSSARLVSFSR